jgi:energy-coupling factor transport system substrate-specific component
MKKIFKKFQVKDFVFLAVLSAAMTLCGGITMPLVMHTTVFGLRNMAAAPIYSIFVAIGLMKVRKPGALTIIGLFSGAPLIFFSTVMFFNNFVSAIIAELIMLLIFRGYQKKVSVFVTTGIYMPFSLPISVLFSLWLNGQSYAQLTANPKISVLTSIGTIILAFFGAAIGMKIAAELQKAGKLKPYGEDDNA